MDTSCESPIHRSPSTGTRRRHVTPARTSGHLSDYRYSSIGTVGSGDRGPDIPERIHAPTDMDRRQTCRVQPSYLFMSCASSEVGTDDVSVLHRTRPSTDAHAQQDFSRLHPSHHCSVHPPRTQQRARHPALRRRRRAWVGKPCDGLRTMVCQQQHQQGTRWPSDACPREVSAWPTHLMRTGSCRIASGPGAHSEGCQLGPRSRAHRRLGGGSWWRQRPRCRSTGVQPLCWPL